MASVKWRRFLLWAFAISLLAHLLFAVVFRWPNPRVRFEEPTLVKVREIRVARETPHPRIPTPAPQRARPVRKARVSPPHIATHRAGARTGQAAARVARLQTAAPSVAPSPARGCVAPNTDAAVAAKPDAPQLSAQARSIRTSGTAAIDVALDAAGQIVDARVAQTSGNVELDAAAVQMARAARYSPKYEGCKAVAGEYTFRVKFVAW